MIWWYVLAFFGECVAGMLMMSQAVALKNNHRDPVRIYKSKDENKIVFIKIPMGIKAELHDIAELETLYADDKPIMYVEKQREQMGTDEK